MTLLLGLRDILIQRVLMSKSSGVSILFQEYENNYPLSFSIICKYFRTDAPSQMFKCTHTLLIQQPFDTNSIIHLFPKFNVMIKCYFIPIFLLLMSREKMS
uniref:Uncharacterized protein n=1 Tax=Lepeophtheirus salmonis TaxID=72036 RepID=A0A0K2SX19_LEPSM